MMTQKPRLYYAAGPGNVVGTLRHWREGQDDPSQFARTYSGQFFDLAARIGAEALVVSTGGEEDTASAGGITAVNRPLPTDRCRGGFSFWWGHLVSGYRIWQDCIRFRPHAAVIAEGSTFFLLLLPLRWLGVRFVPTVHCVLRRPHRRGWPRRMLEAVEIASLRVLASHCLTASREIAAQVRNRVKCGFLPSYRETRFDGIGVPRNDDEFRLLYVGRIESDKGVFDLLEAFARARVRGGGRTLRLDYCGTGGAEDELARQVRALDLVDSVRLHGHCRFEVLREMLAACHIVMAPTTSRFVEGFNQVIVEGVLAGRPVIATTVCPSARLFRESVRLVAPDDTAAMAEAIESLAGCRQTYASAVAATVCDRKPFFQFEHSWEAALESCLEDLAILPHPDMQQAHTMKNRIGYLVPQFPSQTHAFFWREVSAIRAAGAHVQLLSTRPPAEGCAHEFADEARDQTTYLEGIDLISLLHLLRSPNSLRQALGYLFDLRESTLAERLKVAALIPAAARLVRLCRKQALEHVHIHSCASSAHIAALANRIGGLSYSLTLHGDLPVYGKDHALKTRRARTVSAVTRPLRNQLLEYTYLTPEQVPVITMGVDTDRFAPGPELENRERLRILTVARLIPQKGHREAFAALEKLRETTAIDFEYLIAGDGRDRAAGDEEVARLGLGELVRFLGTIGENEVVDLMRSSDIFLLPSYGLGEAAPVCVMEAMSCGLPVICSRIGGTGDMICSGRDGFLTPQKNPRALAEVLRSLCEDSALRRTVGNRARETAMEKFDYRVNAVRLLESITEESSRAASGSTEGAPLPVN